MNRKEIQESNPEVLKLPHIEELAAQSDKLHALKALSDTEGGKELVKILLEDTVNHFHTLRSQQNTASEVELRSLIATMNAHYETARLLINAEESAEAANEQLDEALKDALID